MLCIAGDQSKYVIDKELFTFADETWKNKYGAQFGSVDDLMDALFEEDESASIAMKELMGCRWKYITAPGGVGQSWMSDYHTVVQIPVHKFKNCDPDENASQLSPTTFLAAHAGVSEQLINAIEQQKSEGPGDIGSSLVDDINDVVSTVVKEALNREDPGEKFDLKKVKSKVLFFTQHCLENSNTVV